MRPLSKAMLPTKQLAQALVQDRPAYQPPVAVCPAPVVQPAKS